MAASNYTSSNILREHNEKLKRIAELTGDSVTGILTRLIEKHVSDFESKYGDDIKKLEKLEAERNALVTKIQGKGNTAAPAK